MYKRFVSEPKFGKVSFTDFFRTFLRTYIHIALVSALKAMNSFLLTTTLNNEISACFVPFLLISFSSYNAIFHR